MFEILNIPIGSYRELHDRYPNKEALVYDMVEGRGIFDGGMLYALGNSEERVDMLRKFEQEMPGHRCRLLHTSPMDLDGRPYFID